MTYGPPIFRAEHDAVRHQHCADDERSVCNIEHCEGEQGDIQHIDDIAQRQAVVGVAKRAADHQRRRGSAPSAELIAAEDEPSGDNRDDGHHAQHPRLSAEQAERHARIFNINPTKNGGNEGALIRQRDGEGFGEAVKREGQEDEQERHQPLGNGFAHGDDSPFW